MKKYKVVPLLTIQCIYLSLNLVITLPSIVSSVNYASVPDECEQITPSLGPSRSSVSLASSEMAKLNSKDYLSSSSPSSPANSASVSYLCKIQTLNGAFGSFDISRIPSSGTTGLTLTCNTLYESFLYEQSLANLNELKTLHIERCKFEVLPSGLFSGLANLTSLTVRTFNGDWDGGVPLSLPSEILQPLKNLEKVDFSHNQLTSLPDQLFCGLNNLLFINLTSNQFSEVENIGLSSKRDRSPLLLTSSNCINNSTQLLDLSHNHLRVLTDRSFDTSPHLETLLLNNNQIQRAEESSLTGLNELKVLDLSNNGLVALPARFFSPVVNSLKELYLQNNSISVLPPGQFEHLREVVFLNLSHNKITDHWINSDTFVRLTDLVKLDLSHNKLKKIDASTFKSQTSLETLLLHHNEIETISDHAFSSLINLQKLVLSHNHLIKLDSLYCFSGLSSLVSLNLDHNRIEYIHVDTFHNLSNLVELNLSHNWLRKTVPVALSSLHSLLSLDLSHNHLTDISNASYKDNRHLYELHLEGNKIGSLTRGVFSDLPYLRILNLAHNEIDSIGPGTFNDVPDLHALRLDSNGLTNINELFADLRDLLMLNISANRVTWFDYAHIPTGLQSLDIHDNLIEVLGNHYPDQVEYSLKFLDASSNRLTHISRSSLPKGIEVVILSNNSIHKVEPATFFEKQNLTRVDLTNNKLTTLDISSFRLSKDRPRRSQPEFNVSKNPYSCDCSMEWIHDWKANDEYPKIVDRSEIFCEFAFKRRLTRAPLLQIDPSMLLCSYKSHCFALCHCCEFDHCDCEMTCPENCSCYYDRSWSTNIVDCSSSSHQTVPNRIPMDATQVYLDGNQLPVLSGNTFIGRKNMKILHLNNSNIQVLNNRTFNGLTVLEELNLSHNQLIQLYGYEFDGLVNLTRLDLSFNRIQTIDNNTFATLKLLQVLHLHHNLIHNYQLWSLSSNNRLQRITLSGNPWSCECDFINYAISWMHHHQSIITDSYYLECFYNETNRLLLSPEFNTSSCTNYSAARKMLAQQLRIDSYLPIFVVSGSIMIVFVFIVILIYRREMSVWFYSRFGVRLNGRSISKREDEKLYDAFISYSKKDEAFVSQALAPEMEYGNPPYRMCLLYRDLPVASGYLSDAIVNAMEASQRTIIVLSENFLKGEWCRYEFRSSHLEVLRTTRQRLIIISFGKISPKDLDPDMRFWLKSATLLQWGEKLFWDKLRYGLPDIAYARKPADA